MRTLAFAVSVLASLILMPILIHNLGPRGYGMWATIGSIVSYYGLLDLGLASTTERFLARSYAKKETQHTNLIFSTSIFLFIGIGLLFSIVTILISLSSGMFFTDPREESLFRYAFLILGMNFGLSFPFYAVEGALAAGLHYDKIAIARIISTIVRTVAAIVVVKAGYSLIVLAFVIVLSSLTFYSFLLIALKKVLPDLRLAFADISKEVFFGLFHHGKFVFIGNVSTNAHFKLSNVIISAVIGLSAVTIFAVAARLSEYLQSLVQRIFNMFLPILSEASVSGNKRDFEESFWIALRINVVFTTAVYGFAIIAAQPFIRIWLGSGFEESYVLFIILSTGLALKQMQVTSLQALMALSKHKTNNLIELGESLIAIPLAVFLGFKFGLLGIAFGIAVPMVLNKAFLQPIIRCRDLEISTAQYYGTILKYSSPMMAALMPFLFIQGLSKDLGSVTSIFAIFSLGLLTALIAFFTLPVQIRSRLTHIVRGYL